MKKMLRKIAYVLVVTGTLNFLMGDLFGYNPVDETFGRESAVTLSIYAIGGVAVVYVMYDLLADVIRHKGR